MRDVLAGLGRAALRHPFASLFAVALVVILVGLAWPKPSPGEVEAERIRETVATFGQLMDAGMPCSGLYDWREEHVDPQDTALRERINDELRRVGCYLSTSERTDT